MAPTFNYNIEAGEVTDYETRPASCFKNNLRVHVIFQNHLPSFLPYVEQRLQISRTLGLDGRGLRIEGKQNDGGAARARISQDK